MSFTYQFFSQKLERAVPESVVYIHLNGVVISRIPLGDKIVRGFVLTQLEHWLGKQNAGNIVNHGERVTLTREREINFDFSRFKP